MEFRLRCWRLSPAWQGAIAVRDGRAAQRGGRYNLLQGTFPVGSLTGQRASTVQGCFPAYDKRRTRPTGHQAIGHQLAAGDG